jgi:hypothetical protein
MDKFNKKILVINERNLIELKIVNVTTVFNIITSTDKSIPMINKINFRRTSFAYLSHSF